MLGIEHVDDRCYAWDEGGWGMEAVQQFKSTIEMLKLA
jgi:hypothetical protein